MLINRVPDVNHAILYMTKYCIIVNRNTKDKINCKRKQIKRFVKSIFIIYIYIIWIRLLQIEYPYFIQAKYISYIWRLCTVHKYWITICYITLTTVSVVTSGLSLFNTLRHEKKKSTVFNTTYSIAFSWQQILMTMSLKLVLKGLQLTNN